MFRSLRAGSSLALRRVGVPAVPTRGRARTTVLDYPEARQAYVRAPELSRLRSRWVHGADGRLMMVWDVVGVTTEFPVPAQRAD